MKTKFNGILTLLLALTVQFVFAQKTVSGTVSDENGPLPGVNVLIKGTKTGAETDFDGKYAIQAKQGDVLVFSYIGMATIEKEVGSANVIDVLMLPDNVLEEVVIVGYGTTTKKSYVGTATAVKSENLEVKSNTNVSKSLTGEVAGVNVINTSGQPGTVATIRIRGFGSVNGNRNPLYVVDGVPFEGSINSINPNDIESTTILKDATATAIYGSRGANGVILINTKSGKKGQSNIEFDIKTGFNANFMPRNEVIESPEEYIAISWNAMYNKGVATNEPDPVAYANANLFGGQSAITPQYNMWNVTDGSQLIDPNTGEVRPGVTRKYNPEDWEDYGFQAAYRTEANVRFSGGTENAKYFSSIGYLDDEGYIINSDYKRYSARLNLTQDVKSWLKTNVNIGYTNSGYNNNGQSSDSGSIFWFVDNIPSIFPLFLRDASGNIVEDPIFGGNQYDYGVGRAFGALTNSIADAHYDGSYGKRNELNGNVNFDFKIFDFLHFETKYGIQYFNDKYTSVNNPYYGSAATPQTFGSLFKRDTEVTNQSFLQLLRFKKDFGKNSLEIFAAHETNEWDRSLSYATKNKVVVPGIDELSNYIMTSSPPGSYSDTYTLESYFGQLNYNFDNKYYLTGAVRRDGSSRFLQDKWGTFGSVGASWVVSEESFFENKLVSYLKIKTSYGILGDQAGVDLYSGYNTFGVSNVNDNYSIFIDGDGYESLTWESSKMFQTGLEISLGKYVDVNLDYYLKNTDNLFFNRRVGPSQGIAIILVNDGQLRNSGLEFDVNSHLVNKDNFKLNFTINGEIMRNEITTMPIEPSTELPKIIDINSPYAWSEGHSIYDFYVREWAGVDPADGVGMWYQYFNDINGNGLYDGEPERVPSLHDYQIENPDVVLTKTVTKDYAVATQQYIGKSAIPKLRGGFRFSASFLKNFEFGAQFIYSLGGYSYDSQYANLMDNDVIGSNNWHIDIRDRWMQPGDISDIPRLSSNIDTNVAATSSRFIQKADYLGLNNVMLGYNLPSDFISRIGIEGLNLSLTADNLYMLTARKGFNPTTSEAGSTDQYNYSPLSTFTLGVRVKL